MDTERFKSTAVLIVLIASAFLAIFNKEFIPIWSSIASTVIGGYFGAMIPQSRK